MVKVKTAIEIDESVYLPFKSEIALYRDLSVSSVITELIEGWLKKRGVVKE